MAEEVIKRFHAVARDVSVGWVRVAFSGEEKESGVCGGEQRERLFARGEGWEGEEQGRERVVEDGTQAGAGEEGGRYESHERGEEAGAEDFVDGEV